MGISCLSHSIRFLSKDHPLPPSRESCTGLIFLLVPKTPNSPLDARAWLDRTATFGSLSQLWCWSPCVCACLEHVCPRRRVLWSVAGTGRSQAMALMRKYCSAGVRPPARRLQNKSQSCSELAGLTSCFLCLRTKPEDKPQNAGGDT